jgi:hypothetical protein
MKKCDLPVLAYAYASPWESTTQDRLADLEANQDYALRQRLLSSL